MRKELYEKNQAICKTSYKVGNFKKLDFIEGKEYEIFKKFPMNPKIKWDQNWYVISGENGRTFIKQSMFDEIFE